MMIRQELKNILNKMFPDENIIIDYVPKGKEGDYSTNLALKIAAKQKLKAKEIAKDIASKIKHPMISNVTIHEPGFVNFEISEDYLLKKVFEDQEVLKIGENQRILIEYVSANPTGPINVVSARAAAVGDSLVRLLKKVGFKATAEYYINDAGRQTLLLAESIKQRINEIEGGTAQIPENGYYGEYLIDVAKKVRSKHIENTEEIRKYAVNHFVEEHRNTLRHFGVEFDNWILESEICKKGYVENVLDILKKKALSYSKDGATWFKATVFGDIDDRVIITSDGRYTYLLSDVAYHLDKIRRKHDKLIDIWGPDHHGRIKGLIGGITALDYPEEVIKIIIVQEVKLRKGGNLITMSKRAGTFEKLDELLEQVPKDVVRFFLVMRSNSQPLDFDLDLALKESEENPVYYVQYAHARIKSIIRKAKQEGTVLGRFDPYLTKQPEEITLIRTILKFPEVLEDAARNYEPYMITYYLIDLARTFHYFYQKIRVISDDRKLTLARLALINRTAETIKDGLDILGISCPERM